MTFPSVTLPGGNLTVTLAFRQPRHLAVPSPAALVLDKNEQLLDAAFFPSLQTRDRTVELEELASSEKVQATVHLSGLRPAAHQVLLVAYVHPDDRDSSLQSDGGITGTLTDSGKVLSTWRIGDEYWGARMLFFGRLLRQSSLPGSWKFEPMAQQPDRISTLRELLQRYGAQFD